MKKVSRWATRNPKSSRLIITLAMLTSFVLAISLGVLTYCADIMIPKWSMYLLGSLFFLTVFLYPNRKSGKSFFKHSYGRQKACEFTLFFTAMLVIASGVNHFAYAPKLVTTTEATAKFIVYSPQQDQVSKVDKSFLKKWKKDLRTKLKSLKQSFKSPKYSRSDGEIAFLLILMILGVVVSAHLVATLSCYVFCTFAPTVGAVVLILGILGIILLSSLMLKSIFRKEVAVG